MACTTSGFRNVNRNGKPNEIVISDKVYLAEGEGRAPGNGEVRLSRASWKRLKNLLVGFLDFLTPQVSSSSGADEADSSAGAPRPSQATWKRLVTLEVMLIRTIDALPLCDVPAEGRSVTVYEERDTSPEEQVP